MKKHSLSAKSVKAIAGILVILFLTSLYLIYHFQSIPDKKEDFIPAFSYSHRGFYEYSMTLRPSKLYSNRTILMPDEIPYIQLVNLLNISFTYAFETSPNTLANANITYSVKNILEEPGGWQRSQMIIPLTTKNFTSPEQVGIKENLTFNVTEIDELIRGIQMETLTVSPTYNLKITPQIKVEALVGDREISEDFAPTLLIKFDYREGNRLSFEGQTQEKKNTIGETKMAFLQWVSNARLASYILSAALLFTTAYTSWLAYTQREKKPLTDKILKKYRDLIVDSTGEFSGKLGNLVNVRSMDDLVHVAEQTYKPIIHRKREVKGVTQHCFYVLESEAAYEYCLEERVDEAEEGATLTTHSRTFRLKTALLTEFAEPAAFTALSMACAGLVILGWIGWLVWYDATVWNKNIQLIMFGDRTGEALSLGIGLKVIHYFILGLALLLLSLIITVVQKRKRKR